MISVFEQVVGGKPMWYRWRNSTVPRCSNSLLEAVLRAARAGSLPADWRSVGTAELADRWRTMSGPTTYDLTPARAGVYAERADLEIAILALRAVVEAPESDWEPARAAAVGPVRAVTAWYEAMSTVLDQQAVEAPQRGDGPMASTDRVLVHLDRAARDLLRGEFEALMSGLGDPIDWVGRARYRAESWPLPDLRAGHLTALDNPAWVAERERLPSYWRGFLL